MRSLTKIVAAVLLLGIPSLGTTYYVKNGGNDMSAGTTTGTAWAHIPGMVGCANNCTSYVATAGDHFVIIGNAADNAYAISSTWTIPSTFHGASGNPISISAYSAPVIFTGMKKFTTGWTSGGSLGNCTTANGCTLYKRTLAANTYYNFESLFYSQAGGTPMRRSRPSTSANNACAVSNDSYVCQTPTGGQTPDQACGCPVFGSWSASTSVNAGTVISDGTNLEVGSCSTLGINSCTTGGTTPTWPTDLYTPVSDGGVVWTMTGKVPQCAVQTGSCTVSGQYECFNRYHMPTAALSGISHGMNIGDIELKFHKIWAWSDLRVSSETSLGGSPATTGMILTGADVTSGAAGQPSNDGCLASVKAGITTGNLAEVDNAEELLAKGQWYLDRCPTGCTGNLPEANWTLYIAATSGENPNSTDAVFIPQINPASPQLIIVNGASYLTFTNLNFEGDNYVPPPQGLADSQGMPLVPAAISCRNCLGVVFGNSTGNGVQIEHTTAKGIEFLGTSNGNYFSNSACQDIGAGCVFIGTVALAADTASNVPYNNTVTNTLCNYPHQLQPSGEATGCVYIGDSYDNSVENNDCIGALSGCFDLGHGLNRGLSSGPNWNNFFMYGNHVSNNTGTGRAVTGGTLALLNDFGLLYAADNASVNCPLSSGDPGTTYSNFCNFIEGNIFHDAASDFTDTAHHGATCIYLDQGSSYNYVSKNLCYRIAQDPFFNNTPTHLANSAQYIGQYNHFTNNIIAGCGASEVANTRCINVGGMNENSATVDHNIFLINSQIGSHIQSNPGQWGAFDYQSASNPPPNVDPTTFWNFNHNLYWDMSSPGGTPISISFSTCKWDTVTDTDNCKELPTNYTTTTSTTWGTVTQWGSTAYLTEDSGSYVSDPWFMAPVYGTDDWTPNNTAALSNIGFTTFTPSAGRTDTSIAAISASTLWPTTNIINPSTDYLPSIGIVTAPVPGTTLSGTSGTFSWSAGSGVTSYELDAGGSAYGTNYYSKNEGTSLSDSSVHGLPNDGSIVYITLTSTIGGNRYSNVYTYTAHH